jgi:hypothetical protein
VIIEVIDLCLLWMPEDRSVTDFLGTRPQPPLDDKRPSEPLQETVSAAQVGGDLVTAVAVFLRAVQESIAGIQPRLENVPYRTGFGVLARKLEEAAKVVEELANHTKSSYVEVNRHAERMLAQEAKSAEHDEQKKARDAFMDTQRRKLMANFLRQFTMDGAEERSRSGNWVNLNAGEIKMAEVASDHSCCYRALAMIKLQRVIEGGISCSDMLNVRSELADTFSRNVYADQLFKAFDEEVLDRMEALKSFGTEGWGTQWEIMAWAAKYNVFIEVFSTNFEFHTGYGIPTSKHVAYMIHTGRHYDIVCRKNDTRCQTVFPRQDIETKEKVVAIVAAHRADHKEKVKSMKNSTKIVAVSRRDIGLDLNDQEALEMAMQRSAKEHEQRRVHQKQQRELMDLH